MHLMKTIFFHFVNLIFGTVSYQIVKPCFKDNFYSLGYTHAAVQQRELCSVKIQVLLTTSWISEC